MQTVLLFNSASATFMTFDATNKGSNITISGSNLIATNSTSTGSCAIGNVFHAVGAGKYYCEITETHTSAAAIIGLIKSGYTSTDLNAAYVGATVNTWGLFNYGLGAAYNNSAVITTPVTGGAGIASGTTYCLAWDAAAGNLYMGYISGGIALWFTGTGASSTFASAISVMGTLSGSYTIAVGYNLNTYTLNAGQSAYAGAAPSGYSNW